MVSHCWYLLALKEKQPFQKFSFHLTAWLLLLFRVSLPERPGTLLSWIAFQFSDLSSRLIPTVQGQSFF